MSRTGVLFVCLGNICRSPLARALFSDMVARRGLSDRFDIDSCGTGDWHSGDNADPRTTAIALKNGLPFQHTARQLHPPTDFQRFDIILAMDRSNRRNITLMGETHSVAPRDLRLMRSFDPTLAGAEDHALDVPDPYYGGPEGFQLMYEMLTRACEGLLTHLTRQRT